MSKRYSKKSEKAGDISNGPLKSPKEDKLPKRRPDLGDSYDEDFDDDTSVKGSKNAPGTMKSPKFAKSSIKKSSIGKNASMANLKPTQMKGDGSSSQIKRSMKVSKSTGRFKAASTGNQRTPMKRNMFRSTMNYNSTTSRIPGKGKVNISNKI